MYNLQFIIKNKEQITKIQNSEFKKQKKIKYRRTAVRLFYNNSTIKQLNNSTCITFAKP